MKVVKTKTITYCDVCGKEEVIESSLPEGYILPSSTPKIEYKVTSKIGSIENDDYDMCSKCDAKLQKMLGNFFGWK